MVKQYKKEIVYSDEISKEESEYLNCCDEIFNAMEKYLKAKDEVIELVERKLKEFREESI